MRVIKKISDLCAGDIILSSSRDKESYCYWEILEVGAHIKGQQDYVKMWALDSHNKRIVGTTHTFFSLSSNIKILNRNANNKQRK